MFFIYIWAFYVAYVFSRSIKYLYVFVPVLAFFLDPAQECFPRLLLMVRRQSQRGKVIAFLVDPQRECFGVWCLQRVLFRKPGTYIRLYFTERVVEVFSEAHNYLHVAAGAVRVHEAAVKRLAASFPFTCRITALYASNSKAFIDFWTTLGLV